MKHRPPGPTTPLPKLEQTIKFALSTLPHQKIVIGLPTYGYDWGPTKGEPLQYQDVTSRLFQLKASAYRDSSSTMRSDYTVSGINHQVWFEDYQSMQRKVTLTNSLGVFKFCFWRLGGEDSRFWTN